MVLIGSSLCFSTCMREPFKTGAAQQAQDRFVAAGGARRSLLESLASLTHGGPAVGFVLTSPANPNMV